MARVLSGIQPTGSLTLGGYLGAVRHWVSLQDEHDVLVSVVDLHAMTVDHDPKELNRLSLELATALLAAGIEPSKTSLFLQSHIAQHAQLAWVMQCTARDGELRRMTQFKDKGKGKDSVSAALLTYPTLMAADVLLYDSNLVPVGDDQRQHLELTRDLAIRFNNRFGETFVVPEALIFPIAARVMNLQNPTQKMSKSDHSPLGTLYMLDEPAVIQKKISKAVTDAEGEVRYDPAAKPGISNLLELLGAVSAKAPQDLAAQYTQYGPLKSDTASAIIEHLEPVRTRYEKLKADPAYVMDVLRSGKEHAEPIAQSTYNRVAKTIGLLEG